METRENRRWLLLGLLVVSVCINYVDRGNLSVASEPIGRELHLSPQDKGLLFSAFFWTYAFCLPFSGWLIDRFRVSRVYTWGYALWSIATVLTATATGIVSLFSLRLVLGIGESVAYPAYSKIISERFDEDHRGTANAWIDAGSKSGPALGVLAGALLLENFGWRGMFFCIGITSLLWLIPWWLVTRGDSALSNKSVPAPANDEELPSFREILSCRSAWGTMIGLFCANYYWYFMLTWLPPYLVGERHYSVRMLALLGSLPFWGTAAASIAGGWASDRWIQSGASPSRVRKIFVCSGLLLGTLLLPAFFARNNAVSLGFILAASLCYGIFSSNVWAVTQTLAGIKAAGKWTGIQNAFANLAGIAAPWITGAIVSRTDSYFLAFASVATMLVLGAVSYLVLVGRIEEISWSGKKVTRL